MTIDPGFVLALVLALVAAVVWLVRLEGKITRVDERHQDLKTEVERLRTHMETGKVYVFRRRGEGDEDA